MGGGSGPTTQARFVPFQFRQDAQDGEDKPFVIIDSTFIKDNNVPLNSIVSSNGKAVLIIGDATDLSGDIVVHNIVNSNWKPTEIMRIRADDIVNDDYGWSFRSTDDQTITVDGVQKDLADNKTYYVGYNATNVTIPVVVDSATSGRDQPATLYTGSTTISYSSFTVPGKSSVWRAINYDESDQADIVAGSNESNQMVDATSYSQSGLTAGDKLNPSTSISYTITTDPPYPLNTTPANVPNGTPVTSTFTYTDSYGKDWNTTIGITTADMKEVNSTTSLAAVTNGDGIESAMFVTEGSAFSFGNNNFRFLTIGGAGDSYITTAVTSSTDNVNYQADELTTNIDVTF